jgi:hypothetical protein
MPESSTTRLAIHDDDRQPATRPRLDLGTVLIGAVAVAGALLAAIGFSGHELMEAAGTVFLLSMGGLVAAVVVERIRRR